MGDGSLSQADIDALLMGDEDADGGEESAAGGDDLLGDLGGATEDQGASSMGGFDALESLAGAIPTEEPKKAKPKQKRTGKKTDYEDSANMELLLDVKMNLSVELGRTKMKVDNVLNLGSGAIVELDKLNGELVDVMVNNRLVARGEVVAVDETFGVKVIEIIDPEERFKIEML